MSDKTMSNKLARVHWVMGQTLLPDHLIAQEQSLAAECLARFRIAGLPAYGVARMQWNETLLQDGVLAIKSLTAIFPSGLLADIPGNAKTEPFNLNISGHIQVSVYAHLLAQKETADVDEDSGDYGETVTRHMHHIALSSDQAHVGAQESLRLGVFHKDPEGGWGLAPDSLPPFLQVGASPYLRKELVELAQLMEVFLNKISQEIAVSYLSEDNMSSAKACHKSTLRVLRMLNNLAGQIHLHPYYVYEALKELLAEVAFYRGLVPEQATAAYDHEDLGKCFGNILDPLKQHIRLFQHRSPYLPFEHKDGMLQLDFPEAVREAKEVYLLAQKNKVHDYIDFEAFKMASRSRLPLIHKMALQGVPLKRTDRPSFQHRFGPEVEFFQVLEGDEWDQALRELSLVFYDMKSMQNVRFYLYWRG